MRITLSDAGKRFNHEWVFRHFNYQFSGNGSYAITGPNGSGKSTLLQIIAGAMMLSQGKLLYDGKEADANAYKQLSMAAPYIEVIEEMTALEFFNFHQLFKPFIPGFSSAKIIEAVQLSDAGHKQIRYYSSGMKQRIKLAQAVFSDVPVVLLDEPCSNLDAGGIKLYHQLIKEYGEGRLLIVCSNDEQEYSFCKERIDMRHL